MLGAIIGAGASLASSLLGSKSAKDNVKYQKQFAQNQVQWKVEDAKKAGIHPLAALGMPTHSFSPVSTDHSGIAQAGQDIGRAVDATRDKKERVDAYTQEVRRLSLEKGGLENQILRAELASKVARVKQPGSPPASPNPANPDLIPGQGNSPGIENKGMERQGWKDGNPSQEAGAVTDTGHARTGQGTYAVTPSKDVKDRIEDIEPAELSWFLRNQVIPSVKPSHHNPPYKAPYGKYWELNPVTGEYKLYDYRPRGPGRFSPQWSGSFKKWK